ncbi:MAG: sugar kinase [Clostridia bacterium]|nr:sugar kinase [Clostridia bacterium]MBR2874533.1 sugar kinase [Clostridia bacterium]
MDKKKIVALGEIMLRLTPPDYTTISEARNFVANYGGGEANVLASLSHFGHKTEFLTKLPENHLGDSALGHLQGHGVDVSHVVRGASNIGMYFVETGFGGRPSKVIYNRKHSAITRIEKEEIDYDEVFSNAKWFHLSGITLALGDKVREVVFACLEACKKYGVVVSFDFNYRSKLWTLEEARPYFKKVIPYVDVLFANYFDIHEILELELDEDISDNLLKKVAISRKLIASTNIKYVFGKDRVVHSATDNSLSSYCVCKDGQLKSNNAIRFSIYDRIGSGDAFAAGVIHGLLKNFEEPEYALNFGLAASILKHTLYGDVLTLSVEEVEEFIRTKGDASVQR